MQVESAFEKATQWATKVLQDELEYEEEILDLLAKQEQYGVKLTDNQGLIDWVTGGCIEDGPDGLSACPQLSDEVKEHLFTPDGAAEPIAILGLDEMKSAVDQLMNWAVDVGVRSIPIYDVYPYQRWTACKEET